MNEQSEDEKKNRNSSSGWWWFVVGGLGVLVLLIVIAILVWAFRKSPQPITGDLAAVKSWLQRVPNVSDATIRNELAGKQGFSTDLTECIVRDRLACPQLYSGYREPDTTAFQFSGDVPTIAVQMSGGDCAYDKYKKQLNSLYNECFKNVDCETNPSNYHSHLAQKYNVPECAVQDLREKTGDIYHNWNYGRTGDVGALSSTLQGYQIPESVVRCVLKKGKRCAL